MLLKLYNNTSKKSYELAVTSSGDYRINYKITLQLEPDINDGEYEYKLYDTNNKMVSRGLLIIGDYVPENTTYTKAENGYVQYEG